MNISLSPKLKIALQAFLIAILYGLSFYLIQLFFCYIGILVNFPDSTKLLAYDASWYSSIVKQGYTHNINSGSNTGFFLLFPLVWKASGLGVWGISCLNLIFFSSAFAILISIYPLPINTQLVWLSTPSLFYMFVPYSEALFFLLCTLCFYSIVKDRKVMIFATLFLISLTRSVSILLIPAFIIMLFLTNENNKWKEIIKEYILIYLSPLIIGLSFFCWYQHYITGIWFDYFYQQSKFWGHEFAIPTLPFSNPWMGWRILWFNALALFVSVLSVLYLIKCLYRRIKGSISQDKLMIISACYLAFTMFFTFFFNPVWGGTTNVVSSHRYIFATPFFFIAFAYFINHSRYEAFHFISVFFSSTLFWLFFGSYHHLRQFLVFEVSTLILLIYMLYANRLFWPAMLIMALNIFLQISFFQIFINGTLPE